MASKKWTIVGLVGIGFFILGVSPMVVKIESPAWEWWTSTPISFLLFVLGFGITLFIMIFTPFIKSKK